MTFEFDSNEDDSAILVISSADDEDGVMIDVSPGGGFTLRIPLYHREMLALREEIDKEVE